MKKLITVLIVVVGLALCLTACSDTPDSTDPSGGGIPPAGIPGDNFGDGGISSSVDIDYDDTLYDASAITAKASALSTTVADDENVTDYTGSEYTEIKLDDLDGDYSITKSGNYVFSGTTTYRIVLAKKDISLHLWFSNATADSVFSDKKPASTVITLVGNNALTGVLADVFDDAKGTLNVKNDLVLNGSGTLTVASAEKNAVHCTGKLKITDITLEINAGKHGIRGNDAVIIDGATLTITAGKDGIQTDDETDDKDIGYVVVSDADINITSGDDGICAATCLYIKSGDIDIKTNGGAPSRITETSSDNADGKGLKVGSITYAVSDDVLSEELAKGGRSDTGEDDEGLSLVEISDTDYYSIVILDGDINIDSNDDAVHSDGSLIVSGGQFTIRSGDDGMHSESVLKIEGGTIDISACYEGIESAKLEILGGDISINSTDDGLNAADGTSNVPGVSNDNCYILIKGGTINIDADGDGVDSNGTLVIKGGALTVYSSTNGADGALDSDGGTVINGGTVIACGATGMAEYPASNSEQNVVCYTANSNISTGSSLSIKDSDGVAVLSFVTTKKCQFVTLSCSELTSGKTYELYLNDKLVDSFTIESAVTTIGKSSSFGPGGQNPGRPGGILGR